ncbi:MAG: hypothetical protein MUF10_18265, partial [Thermoanaerobaculaceae bacterium]|nr:hypothetical protein [Thermoanaerobaculaceae bacterium]
TSERPVVRVEARIERQDGGASATPVATVELRPAPANLGGVSASGTAGLWQAEWTASGLDDATYAVAITARDASGHADTDRSLRFSDPIAGRDQVGSPSYPDGGMRRLDAADLRGYSFPASAVIDVASGHAYFGTTTDPGRVVKVALGSGSAPPTVVGDLELAPGENRLWSAVIDAAAGYAYFGTSTSPGQVVKVALGSGSNPPSRVGSVTLESGEDDLRSAVIDAASGHAYFGTNTNPGRVVKVALGSGSNPPTRVGAVTLENDEADLRCAVIDPASGFAYFGTMTMSANVVKVALGSGSNPPTRVGAVTLAHAQFVWSAVIDAAAGYAYFGTGTNFMLGGPVWVVKVALGSGSNPPTQVGAMEVDGWAEYLSSAVIDPASGYAYFGSNSGTVGKVALGSGSSPPTLVGTVTPGSRTRLACSAVIDVTGGHAYFGTIGTGRPADVAEVAKVALGSGSNPPSQVASTVLESEAHLRSAVIDATSGHAYFGTDTSPGHVVEVALGRGSKPPSRVDALILETGENRLVSALIDPAAGFAYFGTATSPGRVVKVALGNGSTPPTRVGALILDAGEDRLWCAVIDAASGHAYFGTSTSPGRVVKVALGSGSNPPARVGALVLDAGENGLSAAVIDAASGHAYFGTSGSPGRVVKVALGSGVSVPTRVGAVTLESMEGGITSAVIDPTGGHAYFYFKNEFYGGVVKIALGSGANPPTRLAALTLQVWGPAFNSAIIDAASGNAYSGASSSPGHVEKVALGSGSNPPTRVGAMPLESWEEWLSSAVMDTASGHAYLGVNTSPGRIVRVGLSQQGFIKATRLTMPEAGRVRELRLYSHAAQGNVRLALYDTAATPHLLWQSGVLPNSAANAWLATSIATGTPASLVLPAGTYWLAWQVDTAVPVPSHATGAPGDGLFVPWSWGAFPEALDPAADAAPTLTDEVWSAYLTYALPGMAVVSVVASPPEGGTVSGGGEVPLGQSVTVLATPAPGWTFLAWHVAGAPVSTSPSYTFTASGDVELVAVLERMPPEPIPATGPVGLLLLLALVLGTGVALLRRG